MPKCVLKSAAISQSTQLILDLRCVFKVLEFKPMQNRVRFLARIQTILRVR